MRIIYPYEEEEQKKLYEYCKAMNVEMIHIPNERKCSVIIGKRMKAQGVRSGFPDNLFPYARGRYHGLFIELKRVRGASSRISPEQKRWQEVLRAQGYACEVCYGADEAIACLSEYLNLKEKHDEKRKNDES